MNPRIHTRFVLLLLLLAFPFSDALARKRLFVLAGQSNMVGHGERIGSIHPDSIPEIRIWSVSGAAHSEWIALQHGLGEETTWYGPELQLGETIRSLAPSDTFLFVKTAWSGTSMAEYWRSPARGGPSHCFRLMMEEVAAARAALPQPAPRIDGFFWMQGESDALEKPLADEYRANLKAMLTELRATWGDSSIPVVMGLIDIQPAWPYATEVRASQVAVAEELHNVGYVETIGLETDGVHLKGPGLDELGRRMALRWSEIALSPRYDGMERPSRRWIRVSSDIMLLWGPSRDGVQSYRLVDADGHASTWEPCRVPLDFHRGRLRDTRALLVQLRDPDGAIETVRIPRLWR